MSEYTRNSHYGFGLAFLAVWLMTISPNGPTLNAAAVRLETASQVHQGLPAVSLGQPRLSAYLADKYKQPLAQTEQIVKISFREGRALGLQPELILGIIAKESSFRPTAESGYGAKGLMQVVPRFHEKLLAKHAAGNPFSVDGNIKVGSRILKQYLDAAGGDLQKALARYSGGAAGYHSKVTRNRSEYEKVILAANSAKPL